MITRRRFLQWVLPAGALGLAASAYATVVEPLLAPRVTRYTVKPRQWPAGFDVTIAVIADLHACKPWMDLDRINAIVAQTNSLGADVIVLLGDFIAGHRFVTGPVALEEWSTALAGLKAPLGVHAVLGNHDWWHDDAVKLSKSGRDAWLAGLGDQLAFIPTFRRVPGRSRGVDDLAGTLSKVPDGDPVILLAHEPDVMVRVPERVALVLSGHTHGGQVRLFGWSPVVPSRYGNRYAYGHVREQCDLIVSGGLGCSIMPVRFGMPPEIVHVTVSGA